MAPKRKTRANSIVCTLVHTRSGESFTIPEIDEFTIGRGYENLGMIDEPYISSQHTVIKFVDGQYFISDLDSSSGTFLNHEKLEGGRRTRKVLNHGDIISFGNTFEGADCVFKFCYPPAIDKRHRSDMRKLKNASLKLSNHRKNYKKTLTVLHGKILSIKTEHTALNRDIRSQMAEFETLINKTQLQTTIAAGKRRTEISELKETHVANHDIEIFKNKILSLVESELQCYICNEALIKARVSSCQHSFCEKCFLQWMVRSTNCPACRTSVRFSSHCLSVDNFLTNYYDYIGGTPQAIRDELIKTATKAGSRKEQINSAATLLLLENINGDDMDIVDLTNSD